MPPLHHSRTWPSSGFGASRLFIRKKPGNQAASYAPFGVSPAVEPQAGFEPASLGLQNRLPANWATAACAVPMVGVSRTTLNHGHCHSLSGVPLPLTSSRRDRAAGAAEWICTIDFQLTRLAFCWLNYDSIQPTFALAWNASRGGRPCSSRGSLSRPRRPHTAWLIAVRKE